MSARSTSRPRPVRSAETLAARVRAAAAEGRRREDRRAGRGRPDQADQRHDRPFLKPGAAQLRRHRRARRRVHHLQCLLDDRRPAAARVRDAARAGRLRAPGDAAAHRRGARSWACSPRVARPLRRASAWPPASTRLFKAVGVDIPRSGLVLAAAHHRRRPRPWASSSRCCRRVVPALRATRVPPMAALQEGAAAARRRASRASRPTVAAVVAVLGALLIVGRHVRPGQRRRTRLAGIAFGAVLVFVAVAMVSKYFVRPLARLARLAAREAGAGQRPPGARQQPPQPGAHRGHGVGADDRPRRRRVRGGASPRASRARSSTASTRPCAADYVVSAKNYMMLPATARCEAVRGRAGGRGRRGPRRAAGAGRSGKALTPVYARRPATVLERVWHFDWLEGERRAPRRARAPTARSWRSRRRRACGVTGRRHGSR